MHVDMSQYKCIVFFYIFCIEKAEKPVTQWHMIYSNPLLFIAESPALKLSVPSQASGYIMEGDTWLAKQRRDSLFPSITCFGNVDRSPGRQQQRSASSALPLDFLLPLETGHSNELQRPMRHLYCIQYIYSMLVIANH